MRRLAVAALLLLSACRQTRPVSWTDEGAPEPPLSVAMADPAAAQWLLEGFHKIEEGAWRWTKGKFAVQLRPPFGSTQQGARLVLKFAIPEAALSRTASLAITTAVGGKAFGPTRFPRAGAFVLNQDFPASAFTGEPVRVDFALDRFLTPTSSDPRELGVIVREISFERIPEPSTPKGFPPPPPARARSPRSGS